MARWAVMPMAPISSANCSGGKRRSTDSLASAILAAHEAREESFVMATVLDEFVAGKPLWRRIADFPLIALAVAIAAVGGTMFALGRFVLPVLLDPFDDQVKPAVIGVVLVDRESVG